MSELLRTGKKTWTSIEKAHGFLQSRGIPKRYLNSKMEDFHQYADLDLTKSYYIHGPVGSGKTHLLCALFREVSLGVGSLFVTGEDMMWKLKDSFDATRKRRFQNDEDEESRTDAILTRYMEVDVLAIDDFMMNMNTGWSTSILSRIINNRYNEMLQTFISSNASLVQISETDDRIASRLAQMCEVVELAGKDKRVK